MTMTHSVPGPVLHVVEASSRRKDAPTVLWVHGYTMNAAVWKRCWELLPDVHHVGIDLPGHGHSAPAPRADRGSIADAVIAVADRVGAQSIVGLSLGSVVVLEVLMRAPTRFERCVLAAPGYAGMPEAQGTSARFHQLMRLAALGSPSTVLSSLWLTSPPNIFTAMLQSPNDAALLQEVVATHRWVELRDGSMVQLFGGEQDLERLRGCQATVRILSGTEDMFEFRTACRTLAELFTSVEVHELENVGHLPLLEERSSEAVAALNNFFVARTPAR